MSNAYYKLEPEAIIDDISVSADLHRIEILGEEYLIYPSVYPSDKFRTTNFLLTSINPLLKNASFCDMGCGMGIVGLYALEHGARRVVQADINPEAIKNAEANRRLFEYSSDSLEIYLSDCFEVIPEQIFDIIVFNIPFHSDSHIFKSPLEYAFHDPNFASTQKFLKQAKRYSHSKTKIVIAFSNKGDTAKLEKVFSDCGYSWCLWKRANTEQAYDNRLYLLEIEI